MLRISRDLAIDENDIEISFVRASGPGGQNVNKLSTSAQLRFDTSRITLPEDAAARLARLAGQRMTKNGVIVIQAERFRTQERNKADAIERLVTLLREAMVRPKVRRPTKPTFGSKQRRLEGKKLRSDVKAGRGARRFDDQSATLTYAASRTTAAHALFSLKQPATTTPRQLRPRLKKNDERGSMSGRRAAQYALLLCGSFIGAVLSTTIAFAQMALPAPKPVDGATLFKQQCGVCHTLSSAEPMRQGPPLTKVVGRRAGSVEGFRYSAGFAKADFTWDEARLDAWLTNPQELIPGAVMAYRQAKPELRAAIITYLKDN